MSRVIVHGAGGNTRTVIGVLLESWKRDEIICMDKQAYPRERILGVEVYKEIIYQKDDMHLVSLGDNLMRSEKVKELLFQKHKITYCISNSATIFDMNQVEKHNNMIFCGVYLGPETIIGSNNIINTRCVLEHEVKIGDNNHIAPTACLCGRVEIGNNIFIGANVTVKEKIRICDNVTIGAGAVVVENINESGVYVGIPARKVETE